MRVVELRKHGSPEEAFVIAERQLPSVGPADVKIRVKAFGINFADVLCRLGFYPDCPPLPTVIGYEVSGRVDAVGREISHVKPGDRVIAMTRFGGYAEEVVTPGKAVMKVPDWVSDVDAAALPINGLTAYHCLAEMVKIRKGDRVLIQAAAGGVGTLAVQLAKHFGAEVFGTCSSQEKVEHLRKIGVDHPINYLEKDYETEIKRLASGKRLDIILDSLAGPNIPKEFGLLRAGGRLVVFGVAAAMGSRGKSWPKMIWTFIRAKRFMALELLMASKAIIGVNMLKVADQRPDLAAAEMLELFDLYQKGVVKPYISETFKLEDVPKAHHLLQSRKSIGKIVITTD